MPALLHAKLRQTLKEELRRSDLMRGMREHRAEFEALLAEGTGPRRRPVLPGQACG